MKETKEFIQDLFVNYCGRIPENSTQLVIDDDFEYSGMHILQDICEAFDIYIEAE